jgi:hypothetical protein
VSVAIHTARLRHREAFGYEVIKKAGRYWRVVGADRAKIGCLLAEPFPKPPSFSGARRDPRHGRLSQLATQHGYEHQQRRHRFCQRGLGPTRRAVF